MKRILSVLLSIALMLSGCCPPTRRVAQSYLRSDRESVPAHGQTAFSDMVVSYPDPTETIKSLDRALEASFSSSDAKTLITTYESCVEQYNDLVSAASLAYVFYCQDVTDTKRMLEYSMLNDALYPIQYRLSRLEKTLMDRFGFHREKGASYADALDRISRQNAVSVRSLHAREAELCRRYERLDTDYRLTYRGRTWSMDELMTDESLSLQEFLEMLEAYQIGKNQTAGSMFSELISIRNELAKENGFSSYADHQYSAFGRDFSPEQALQAASVVKQVFVPLYTRLRERCENDLRYLSGASFREDQFIAAMERAVGRVMPGAEEAWSYMLSYGLYDSTPSERKIHSSFTTYLPQYNCPFVLTRWEEDASSVFTVIHEFGHFLSYYLNPDGTYFGAENLDLAETDAQGFELLMLKEYDAIFGRYATAARLCFLTNALYAILSGFMEDEFQQRAYTLPDPSAESLNRLYGALAREYGFDKLFGYEGREWTEIGHTFQLPFYYVSYGVSMLGSMTLVQGGRKAYRRVLGRNQGATFMGTIGKDVLAEENMRTIAAWIESVADEWLNE